MAIRARLAWSSWQFPPIPQSHASYCALLEALRLPHACPPSLGPTEHVLSLGSACFTARFLQQQRLRTHASPFDWVFSSAQMVTHCIESNFASLLDTAEYQRLAGGSVGAHLVTNRPRSRSQDLERELLELSKREHRQLLVLEHEAVRCEHRGGSTSADGGGWRAVGRLPDRQRQTEGWRGSLLYCKRERVPRGDIIGGGRSNTLHSG